MSIKESVKEEINEKNAELRQQYAGEMKSFWEKKRYELIELLKIQGTEYTEFFKNCPQSGRYAGVLITGVLIGMML